MAQGQNASVKAEAVEPAVLETQAVDAQVATVQGLNITALNALGSKYRGLFDKYASERIPVEQKWLKNLRQYLGIYDPEIERKLDPNRAKNYPRLTRVKCVGLLSRIMNLMFPGNEDNWTLKSSPSPEMDPETVAQEVDALIQRLEESGQQVQVTQELVDEAVRELAEKSAKTLYKTIKDQLHELGGDQTSDWISLNRKVVDSGIKFGIGVLEGPYIRKIQQTSWSRGEGGVYTPETIDVYKPMYDFLPVWDFYPDLTARDLPGEGYFLRKILGRRALRKLGDRPDFIKTQVRRVLSLLPNGNYKIKNWETELRQMGTASNTEVGSNSTSMREKYEVIIFKGAISGRKLRECGGNVPDKMVDEDVEAELWMVDTHIIKATMSPWKRLDVDMKTVHIFEFDKDDTSAIGEGLPAIMRDSQLSVCAATRMAHDNASVVCGPNVEVNTRLMRPDQDLTSVHAYKMWYRDDDSEMTAQYPAVREIKFDSHLNELTMLIEQSMRFADLETFVGAHTGGDMQNVKSEAMRTASGGSMLRSDAALPFKDIVRNFDGFTQSVIWSLVQFNRQYNPDQAPKGDYNVIARGATSLVEKEIRGQQLDYLSQTLTEEERDHIDERKFVEAKFAARDMEAILVSEDEAARRKKVRADVMARDKELQDQLVHEEIKKKKTEQFKDITQGQKNAAAGDKTSIEAVKQMQEDPNARPPNRDQ